MSLIIYFKAKDKNNVRGVLFSESFEDQCQGGPFKYCKKVKEFGKFLVAETGYDVALQHVYFKIGIKKILEKAKTLDEVFEQISDIPSKIKQPKEEYGIFILDKNRAGCLYYIKKDLHFVESIWETMGSPSDQAMVPLQTYETANNWSDTNLPTLDQAIAVGLRTYSAVGNCNNTMHFPVRIHLTNPYKYLELNECDKIITETKKDLLKQHKLPKYIKSLRSLEFTGAQ